MCDRYPLGTTVAVYVGPTPSDGAYLDGQISEGREKALSIALAVLLAGGGLFSALPDCQFVEADIRNWQPPAAPRPRLLHCG